MITCVARGVVYRLQRSLLPKVPARAIEIQAISSISKSAPLSSKHGASGRVERRPTISCSMEGLKKRDGDGDGCFHLSPKSLLKIHKGDLTVWSVDSTTDAIVNAANERMLGGGGVDGAIHRAAGPELRAACCEIPQVRPDVRCPTGEARITRAFRLPVAYVIHTVGPVYDVDDHPDETLRKSYRSCLQLAKANDIEYIAFPAISCGVFGYPFKEASKIAISTIKEFPNDFKEVHFVLFSDAIYQTWLDAARELF